MDPRHPEQAISRMRELMKQYDRIEADMNKATTSAQLAQLEREGGLVVQEICLVAPRIHEAMMQASRQRRVELARQILIPSTDEETKKSLEFFKEVEKEEPVEKPVENFEIEETDKEYLEKYGPQVHDYNPEIIRETLKSIEKKTAKKTTRKKKTTKKAEK